MRREFLKPSRLLCVTDWKGQAERADRREGTKKVRVSRHERVTHYAEVVIMRRSASADAELADGCGLSVSQGLRQLHIIPIECNPLGSGFPVSETASQNEPGTH